METDSYLFESIIQNLKNSETRLKTDKAIKKYYKEVFFNIKNLRIFNAIMLEALKGEIRTPLYGFMSKEQERQGETISEVGFNLLIKMNKLGFLTDDSQFGQGIPGVDEDNAVQRSYVGGFLPKKFITKGLHFKNFIFLRTPLLEKENSGGMNKSDIWVTGFNTHFPIKIPSDIHVLAMYLNEDLWIELYKNYDYCFFCDPIWGNPSNGPNGLFTQLISHLESLVE